MGPAEASWTVALSGAIPAIAAMWAVDRMDRKRPEPPRLRRLVALCGMLSVIPAIVLELVVARAAVGVVAPDFTYQGATFKSFVIAAGIEEACKIAVVYWIVWRRPELDERLDGVIYACRAGLGFALVENVLYLASATTRDAQLEMWILRAVLGVPGHALWTGMIGGMAARRRFDGVGLGLLGGYLLAVAFHGLYDVSLFVQVPLALEGHETVAKLLYAVPIALTIAAFLVVRSMARQALRLDDAEAATSAAAAALRGPRVS
jgi:RsiW-degrading membrane proteinase PrsW (M82 family)